MAGTPGNPNHDPKTGRFASASGLNKSNSTMGQRGKAKVKEHMSAAKAFAGAAAVAAVGGVGAAILQGVTKPVRAHSIILANKVINAGIDRTSQLVAAHGPSIANAIKQGGSSLVNHVKNMKSAGAAQHKSIGSASSDYRISPRPRVRHKGA